EIADGAKGVGGGRDRPRKEIFLTGMFFEEMLHHFVAEEILFANVGRVVGREAVAGSLRLVGVLPAAAELEVLAEADSQSSTHGEQRVVLEPAGREAGVAGAEQELDRIRLPARRE